MQEVDPSGIGRAVEKGRVAVLQLAVDGGEHAAQDGLAAVPVLLDPEGEVVGQRLDGDVAVSPARIDRGAFLGRHRFQDPDRESGFGLPGQLESAQDGRRAGHIDESVDGRRVVGVPADPPGVEEVVHGKVAVAAHELVVEDVFALDEEGPLFRVKRLIGGQVDD